MAIATECGQFHVLAVDDSLIDRKLIERLLKTSSYQVTTVDSGSKALEFLGLHDEKPNPPPPDQNVHFSWSQELEVNLIITDYCMPGMTGYDLLKKIKESSSLKDIPVVIMSSENVPSRINRCLEEGAEEFWLKPVKLSDMSRLRPHILKGKNKEQQQEHNHSEDNNSSSSDNTNTNTNTNTNSNSNSSSGSKRKAAMDDEDEGGLSPERTRPRLFSSGSWTVL